MTYVSLKAGEHVEDLFTKHPLPADRQVLQMYQNRSCSASTHIGTCTWRVFNSIKTPSIARVYVNVARSISMVLKTLKIDSKKIVPRPYTLIALNKIGLAWVNIDLGCFDWWLLNRRSTSAIATAIRNSLTILTPLYKNFKISGPLDTAAAPCMWGRLL